jgi:hypothetical protein
MAEGLLQTDVRLIKYFHPRAAVPLGYQVIRRLQEIILIMEREREEGEPASIHPMMPDNFKTRHVSNVKQELRWVREFVFKWDRPELMEGTVNQWLEFFFPDSADNEGDGWTLPVRDPDDCPDCWGPGPRDKLAVPIDCSDCSCSTTSPVPPISPTSPPPSPSAATASPPASPQPVPTAEEADDNATQGIE